MKSSIYIVSNSLKEFLALLNENTALSNIQLGDTWHPSSGFVDEKILNGKKRISEILNFDYDFKGLVSFEANIGSARIEMTKTIDGKEEYIIKGNAREIETIKNKMIEMNSQHLDKYEFDYHIEYDDYKNKNNNRC